MVEEHSKPITDDSDQTPVTPEEAPETPISAPIPEKTSEPPTAVEKPPESIAIEEGAVTPEQIQEIVEGKYWTISELAERMGYSTTWIQMQCKNGRIRGIKPLGHRWRIPESEVQRVLKEGIHPLPREEKRPEPTRITVPAEKADKVAPHRREEEEEEEEKTKEEGRGDYWPLPFPLKGK